MKHILLFLSIAGLVFACKPKKEAAKPAKPSQAEAPVNQPINISKMEKAIWKEIAKGNNSGVETAQQIVIKTEAAWEKAWKEAYGRQMPAPACPELDFTKQYVLACYAGMGANAGYGMEIQSVNVVEKKLKVSITHTKPGKGCMSAEMVVYPFVFLGVENAQNYQAIDFEVNKAVKDCQ
ncbi:MAG: protease complex subunit PrcB family protein [Bacteroidia bacterium]